MANAVEISDDIYRCPCCGGYILAREERTYFGDKLEEEQKWLEHWESKPSWLEKATVQEMDRFGE